MIRGKFSVHGGLTLVPMPGFEEVARRLAEKIPKMSLPGRGRGPHTPVDIAIPKFGRRVNGEPMLEIGKRHIGGHDVVVIGSGPGVPEMLLDLQILLACVAGRRPSRLTLVTGYMPLSRSDKDEGELIFALAPIIINMIANAAVGPGVELSRWITVDLHAPQVVAARLPGFITELSMTRRVMDQAVSDMLAEGRRPVVLYTDGSSETRLSKIVDEVGEKHGLRLPTVVGIKRRKDDKASELRKVFGDVRKVNGADVLAVDDEVATLGTNVGGATAMKTRYKAARVHAVVTHGVLCEKAVPRLMAEDCPIDRVYCTDTVPVQGRADLAPFLASGRLRVTEWWPDMARAIYHHHWDHSIREVR